MSRWNVSLCFFVVFIVQKTITLLIKEAFGFRVHHVQVFFVDEHGLFVKPFLPGLLGYMVEDVLPLGAWEGWTGQTFHVALVFAAENRAAHNVSVGMLGLNGGLGRL